MLTLDVHAFWITDTTQTHHMMELQYQPQTFTRATSRGVRFKGLFGKVLSLAIPTFDA